MAQRRSPKIISKKHLARLERERRQSRIIIIISVILVSFVFLSILYGILNETILINYKVIETVDGEKVTAREFQARARATREQLINQYMYYYQMAVMFGMDPSTDASLTQVFNNIQFQLDSPEAIANQVLTYIEDDLFIRKYAQDNGITISEEEIQAEIYNTYGFFPDGTITPSPTSTSFSYSTLSSAQLLLVTATPAMVSGVTNTPTLVGTAAPTKTPLPTATPVTMDSFDVSYREALDHYRTIGFNETMFRRIFFENTLYRNTIKLLVAADVPHETEQVWIRHILVANEFTAKAVYSLVSDGVDFAKLAADYSTHSASKSKGGDLGWFSSGGLEEEFGVSDLESIAFSLDIGGISQPIKSSQGYHIIQVLGHETRPLSDEEYKNAVDEAFKIWLEDQRAGSTIVVNPDLLSFVPEKPTLQDAFYNMAATQTSAAGTAIIQQQTEDAILALTPSRTPLPPTVTP